jgi:hypothetical protein
MDIVKEYTRLGELIKLESDLGEQMIRLTKAQRKAHLEVLSQKDLVRNFTDNDVPPLLEKEEEGYDRDNETVDPNEYRDNEEDR